MASFKIISDSSCDLTKELAQHNNIEIVPFYISFDLENYYKEEVELKNKDFYKRLREDHVLPKTSLPSVHDYIDSFTPHLENGLDIICFCITSKFSGSMTSAINAKSVLMETYPDRKIEIIDSRQATAGQGLIVLEAAKMQQNNLDFDTVVDLSVKVAKQTKLIFTIDSLEYLEKGGRIGKASALAGSILNIKPIILLDEGELLPTAKCRGRKKAVSEVLPYVQKHMTYDIENYNLLIMHSDVYGEAIEFQKSLVEKHSLKFDYPPLDVGVTIGSHTGRTAIGIAFSPKYTNL